jgi:RimJ/RimL family protein N-acetyltransferase
MPLADWTPRQKPNPLTLDGRLVVLERLDCCKHTQELFDALGGAENADLWRYMPIGPYLDVKTFVEDFEKSRVNGEWNTFVIRVKETGKAEGMLSFMRIRPEHGSVEIGCVAFGHRLQRTSAATEAVYLMAKHAFDDLGYRRLEWKCDDANEASRRAAGRFGFTYEGLFRQDMVRKGANRDTAWYSIIDKEWPNVRKGFERWLDPANFDAGRRQIRTLGDLRRL